MKALRLVGFAHLICGFSLALFGCVQGQGQKELVAQSQASAQGGVPQASPQPKETPPPVSDWDEKTYAGEMIQGRVRTLSQGEQAKARKELGSARLVQMELDEKLKTLARGPLYRIEGAAHYSGTIYIVPRLFVQSGIFGGRVATTSETGGRITLRFPIAFVDGLRPDVISGLSYLPLPDEYVLHDLANELKAKLGGDLKLAAFPGMLQELSIRFGNEKLVARPLVPIDPLPLNQLFEVAVTGTSQQIRSLIEQNMVAGRAQITAVYRLSPQFVTRITSIEGNSRVLRERLFKKFVEMPFGQGSGDYQIYPAPMVKTALEDLIKEAFSEAGIPEPSKMELAPLLDDLISNQFESDDCSEGPGRCLRLRKEPLVDEPSFYFDSFQTESVSPVAEDLKVSSMLRGIESDESRFIIPGENSDDNQPPGYGRAGGLLRPMKEGDLIEIELSALSAQMRQYPAPILDLALSRMENPVCVSWGDPPTREETDYSVCLEWNSECSRSTDVCVREEEYCVSGERECIERGVGVCFFCCKHVDFVCHQSARRCAETQSRCDEWKPTSCKTFGKKSVPAGPAPCTSTQNQWSRFYRLSELPSIITTSVSPTSFDPETLFSTILAQFTHWEPGMTGQFHKVISTCPLSAFSPSVEQVGNSLKVRLRLQNNRDARCEVFNSWNRREGHEPELTLINRLTCKETFACGFREQFWNARIVYTCPRLNLVTDRPIFDSYYPRYQIQGLLRIPGVRFVSSDAKVEIERKAK